MQKPSLVIMAAGMGSRFGGQKQTEPLGPHGQILMDYSIYDAIKAGFGQVVFVIKEEMQATFEAQIGSRIAQFIDVAYCHQTMQNIPQGCTVPQGREKPWGTAHAALSAKNVVKGPFAVINADDYYGAHAFQLLATRLTQVADDAKYQYCMVGYKLGNTLTENGFVSRGVCETDAQGMLVSVTERTQIEKRGDGAAYLSEEGQWVPIAEDATVSMNMWGFTQSFFAEAEKQFAIFLQTELPKNPLKAEFFLPSVVSTLIEADKAQVKVMQSDDNWYGVTYKDDKANVQAALQALHAQGIYPQNMLGL